ncbi:methyl-accepting chemotaxis protein [Halieaceae bacterium IMCC14734]|uniref:Methyl-accepting chemotaxis protein n=1 Tax=Candidatus Litorirhabdus singularis TaxID=2518993 RepID=A0ABT3TDN6_9GAMM|nr:methyl-accepting chemotaxis protein [Candidatus Litorirhabdus singularis]MCX2980425.1 methyl-accepting chemotaxis protein [Candidatus Litorirhabdus singularis]
MSPSILKQRGRVDSIMLLSAVGLAGALTAFAYNIWQMSISSGWDEQYRGVASEMRVTTQDINVSSREAFAGQVDAFAELDASRAQFPRNLNVLQNGAQGVPRPGLSMTAPVNRIVTDWDKVSESVEAILAAQDRILFIREVSENLNTNIKTIQAYYADLVDILGDTNVSNPTLLAAQQQLWLIERIGRNIDRILEGSANAQAAAEEFKQDALMFQRNMEGLRAGDDLRDIDKITDVDGIETLNQAVELYALVSSSVNDIYDAHPELIRSAQAAALIANTTPSLSESVGDALANVDQLADDRAWSGTTATYLAGLSMLLFALIALRLNGARNQERQSQAQAQTTQAEVQQKVYEIQPLAEGNLTRDLTETDGITQPIAVAINQLIAWIREVVTSVNNSSLQVTEAVEASAEASAEVKSSLEEVGSIVADTASTSSELALINNHMTELAETTDQASDEAVEAARQGDDGIQHLMVSVEDIRESQQTVAKTSKRLGDDIEIVADLLFKIREVANSISTLAMNTRIEAASYSGEGGQRFAGIADETGKLANQTNDIVQEADRAIRSVSNRMAESNRNMEGATQSLVKLTGIASDVRERFGHILSLSENTRNYMGDMRQQIQQSGQSSGHVTESVSDILEKILGTQQAANRMDAATNDMRSLFVRLREDTQRFKLEEEDGVAEVPRDAELAAAGVADEPLAELESAQDQLNDLEMEIDMELAEEGDYDAFANSELEQKAS